MATNGIISIIKDGKVVFKCVAGCNGMEAPLVAKVLAKIHNPSLVDVYNTCLEHNLGCADCLVVQSKAEFIALDTGDKLSDLYTTKFSDPKFNPRWDNGTAAYIEVVELLK